MRGLLTFIKKYSIPREYLETAVGVILRLPALFILDSWYKADPKAAVQNATDDVQIITMAAYYFGMFFFHLALSQTIPCFYMSAA